MVRKKLKVDKEYPLLTLGTIDSPEYLKARILYFKNEKREAINRANHMIKWYNKLLKELEKHK